MKEVEDAFNEDDLDFDADSQRSNSIMTRISRKARATLKPSIYVHNTIATSLNVFTMLTAQPFNLLPKSAFILFFVISLMVSYRFIFNYKSYNIFEFEDLFFWLKKKSHLQIEKAKEKKREQPSQFYN